MKKIYTLIGAFALVITANAQTHRNHAVGITSPVPSNSYLKTLSTATLTPPQYSAPCFTTTSLYVVDQAAPIDSGFISGLNAYGDLEKAQKYTVTGNASVTGVLVAAKAKGPSGIKMRIYNVDATTLGPGTTTLGTSNTIALNSFASTGATAFTYSTPVSVSNSSFFVSAVMPATAASADTFGIFTNNENCVGNDSLAWERWDDSSWHSFVYEYGLSLDLSIFPVIDIPSGINSISRNDLSLFSAYPNPATSDITINYSLNKAGNVDIEIYDINGKLLKTISAQDVQVGDHSTKVDVSAFEAGVYMYGVKTQGAKLFSKFTVTK